MAISRAAASQFRDVTSDLGDTVAELYRENIITRNEARMLLGLDLGADE